MQVQETDPLLEACLGGSFLLSLIQHPNSVSLHSAPISTSLLSKKQMLLGTFTISYPPNLKNKKKERKKKHERFCTKGF